SKPVSSAPRPMCSRASSSGARTGWISSNAVCWPDAFSSLFFLPNQEFCMSETITLQAADGHEFPAYVARPSGPAQGAVVVLQEIFGVNSHIRSVADGYAAAGYLAVAPATFERVRPGVELGYTEADMKAGFGLKGAVEALPAPGVMQDLQAAIDHAAKGGKG